MANMQDTQYYVLSQIAELDGKAYPTGLRSESPMPIAKGHMSGILRLMSETKLVTAKLKHANGDRGALRKYYSITAKGRKALQSRREEVKRIYGL